MVYLDYSATTPVSKEVLDSYSKACLNFIGNPNSMHKLGVDAKKLIDASTKQISELLNVKEEEIIYTSGSSEANNTVIKGIAYKYKNRGKHIITTMFEHSSIYAPLTFLENEGYEVDFVKTLPNGMVDLEDLERLIKEFDPKIIAWGRNDCLSIEKSFKINHLKPLDIRSRYMNLMHVIKNYYNYKQEMGLFNTYQDMTKTDLEKQTHDALEDAVVERNIFHLFKEEINKTNND